MAASLAVAAELISPFAVDAADAGTLMIGSVNVNVNVSGSVVCGRRTHSRLSPVQKCKDVQGAAVCLGGVVSSGWSGLLDRSGTGTKRSTIAQVNVPIHLLATRPNLDPESRSAKSNPFYSHYLNGNTKEEEGLGDGNVKHCADVRRAAASRSMAFAAEQTTRRPNAIKYNAQLHR